VTATQRHQQLRGSKDSSESFESRSLWLLHWQRRRLSAGLKAASRSVPHTTGKPSSSSWLTQSAGPQAGPWTGGDQVGLSDSQVRDSEFGITPADRDTRVVIPGPGPTGTESECGVGRTSL